MRVLLVPSFFPTPLEPHRAGYVRDYALSQCYARKGPAQDQRLAQHYDARWQRGLARLTRRVSAQQRQRVGRMGGGLTTKTGPPTPRLPWQYGQTIR